MSERLRAARIEAGFTQQQLADLVGIHLRSVVNYENVDYHGARKPLVVKAWAATCDRSPEEFLGTDRRPIPRTGWFSRTAA